MPDQTTKLSRLVPTEMYWWPIAVILNVLLSWFCEEIASSIELNYELFIYTDLYRANSCNEIGHVLRFAGSCSCKETVGFWIKKIVQGL